MRLLWLAARLPPRGYINAPRSRGGPATKINPADANLHMVPVLKWGSPDAGDGSR
jgi:hypothetical protein